MFQVWCGSDWGFSGGPVRLLLARVITSRSTEMKLQAGVHFKTLRSDLSRDKTAKVLWVLDRAEILALLERCPVNSITIERIGGKTYSGEYHWRNKTITVNAARKLGIQYGAEFQPGKTRNMSAATSDKIESIRRSLLQEVAHHTENSVTGASLIIREAFGNPTKRPITGYAAMVANEYFAESFVAKIVEPKALADYDPVGSRMVEQVFHFMRAQR
jgi:hypothetical protein